MKSVIEKYATSIIAVIMAAVLIGLLLSSLICLGDVIEVDYENKPLKICSGSSFRAIKEDKAPEVYLSGRIDLIAGKPSKLSSLIEGEVAGESVCLFLLENIWTEELDETTVSLSTDVESICISNPGIYWVQADISDAEGGSRQCLVKLFVNER